MSEKIKSIKVKKDYKFSLWDMSLEDLIKKNPEAFEVEYEPETKYWPNGALFDEAEEGSTVFVISNYKDGGYIVHADKYMSRSVPHLLWARIFREKCLFDNQAKAERWAECLNDKMAIEKRLQEINFENDWVANWSEDEIKYWILFDHKTGNFCKRNTLFAQNDYFYMCEEAKNWFLVTNEFTDRQKLHFLEIIN